MLKAGIIGCGRIAQERHIPEYLSNGKAQLAAYYDINENRAQELADRYGGKTYASIEELLADPEIDAVSICTANNAHGEIAVKAMEAGKHVLCEKPMAVTLEECMHMLSVHQKMGVRLMIGQNQRLTKAHQKARQLIQSGEIGKVLTFRTNFKHSGPETWSIDPGGNTWFFDKNKAVMGAMADLGVHKTDLIQYLLGMSIVAATACMATLDKRAANGELISVDDNTLCIYEMSDGAIGTMSVSWTYYDGGEDNSTALYGTEGVMRIYEEPSCSISISKKNGDRIQYNLEKIQTNDTQTRSGIIDEFVESVLTGKASVLDAEEILPSMKAVFACMESARTGKKVQVQ